MKFEDFLYNIADKNDMTKKDCRKIVKSVFDELSLVLAGDDSITIHDFGFFSTKLIAERKTIVPTKNGSTEVTRSAKRVVQFIPSSALQSKLKENSEEDI